ncbi:hypothetical protein A2J03_22895 [Rhodococcus sp. EPR-157]|uniref:hypothetical protein n=1 Tax=Rhodococcus sp. EPR-157 TaxID=1813677 RepID=UPI0007BAFFF9|nr:hypothetical protein [Rhodococcus sp. EPR-157]KZF07413.1 hypothetical protein A2J03_22895 [Rhodococcus sp. EPR-157]
MTEHAPPRRPDAVVTTLVIISIVATGIVVAGLTATPEEPQLTVQPVAPASENPPLAEEYEYVTPEVEYPTTIPGCDTVDQPVEATYSSYFGTILQSYDNPIAPWFSGPKAHLMSHALLAALPSGITFQDGIIPYFDPIPVYEGTTEETAIDSTSAYGSIRADTGDGYLSVGVGQTDGGVPPCIAGDVDERTTMSDGTLVDTLTTWYEVNGDRTYERSAVAYRPDDSVVSVYTSVPAQEDALPLSRDELIDIVTAPGLETSTTPPPGTPGNISECSPSTLTESTREYTVSDVATLDTALRQADTATLAPSPPLGSLRTSGWGGGLCQVVNSAAGVLTIAISDDPQPEPGYAVTGSTVSLPSPSGIGITITTELPWDRADLERLALTPGLDLP